LLPLLALLPAAAAQEDGARLFEPCRACHSLDPAAQGMPGPNLSGLIERKVGGDPAFDYSPVLRKARDEALIWDASTPSWLIPRKCFRDSGCRCGVSRMPRSASPSYAF
jgi:cytochrome c2